MAFDPLKATGAELNQEMLNRAIKPETGYADAAKLRITTRVSSPIIKNFIDANASRLTSRQIDIDAFATELLADLKTKLKASPAASVLPSDNELDQQLNARKAELVDLLTQSPTYQATAPANQPPAPISSPSRVNDTPKPASSETAQSDSAAMLPPSPTVAAEVTAAAAVLQNSGTTVLKDYPATWTSLPAEKSVTAQIIEKTSIVQDSKPAAKQDSAPAAKAKVEPRPEEKVSAPKPEKSVPDVPVAKVSSGAVGQAYQKGLLLGGELINLLKGQRAEPLAAGEKSFEQEIANQSAAAIIAETGESERPQATLAGSIIAKSTVDALIENEALLNRQPPLSSEETRNLSTTIASRVRAALEARKTELGALGGNGMMATIGGMFGKSGINDASGVDAKGNPVERFGTNIQGISEGLVTAINGSDDAKARFLAGAEEHERNARTRGKNVIARIPDELAAIRRQTIQDGPMKGEPMLTETEYGKVTALATRLWSGEVVNPYRPDEPGSWWKQMATKIWDFFATLISWVKGGMKENFMDVWQEQTNRSALNNTRTQLIETTPEALGYRHLDKLNVAREAIRSAEASGNPAAIEAATRAHGIEFGKFRAWQQKLVDEFAPMSDGTKVGGVDLGGPGMDRALGDVPENAPSQVQGRGWKNDVDRSKYQQQLNTRNLEEPQRLPEMQRLDEIGEELKRSGVNRQNDRDGRNEPDRGAPAQRFGGQPPALAAARY